MINTSYQKQKPVSNVDKLEEPERILSVEISFKIKRIFNFLWNEFIYPHTKILVVRVYGRHLALALDKF